MASRRRNKMVSRDTDYEAEEEELQKVYEYRVAVEVEELRKVLATKEGRHVLFQLIGKGDIYDLQASMPNDPTALNRALGRREMALEILKDCLQVNSSVYILMQQEADEFEKQFSEGE